MLPFTTLVAVLPKKLVARVVSTANAFEPKVEASERNIVIATVSYAVAAGLPGSLAFQVQASTAHAKHPWHCDSHCWSLMSRGPGGCRKALNPSKLADRSSAEQIFFGGNEGCGQATINAKTHALWEGEASSSRNRHLFVRVHRWSLSPDWPEIWQVGSVRESQRLG